jgi:hypothetical protein
MLIDAVVRTLSRGLAGPTLHPTDPIRFAARVGFTALDPWQQAVLTSRAPQIVMNCCRQSGKSTAAALLGVWTALTVPRATVLLVAPSVRQSQELYRKCRDALARLGPEAPRTVQESATSLELLGGARIVVIPADEATSRGWSAVTLLCVDEASRVPDPIFFALRPMLAVSRGRIVLLSTPNGALGYFHSVFTGADPEWLRVRIVAAECARIDGRWLAAERERLGRWWASQEFDGEFTDREAAIYSGADIRACISTAVQPLFPQRGAA